MNETVDDWRFLNGHFFAFGHLVFEGKLALLSCQDLRYAPDVVGGLLVLFDVLEGFFDIGDDVFLGV